MALLWTDTMGYGTFTELQYVYPRAVYTSSPYRTAGHITGYCLKPLVNSREIVCVQGAATLIPTEGFICFVAGGAPQQNNDEWFFVLNTGSTINLGIKKLNNGLFSLNRASGVKVQDTDYQVWDSGWHYYSIGYKVAQSGGYLRFYVDHVLVDEYTGLDTGGSVQGQLINSMTLGPVGRQFCHLMVLDTTGAVNNSVPTKDWITQRILPDGDGFHSDFDPLGAGDQYVEVDDDIIDAATSFTVGNAAAEKVSFTVESPDEAIAGDIEGIMVKSFGSNEGLGLRTVRNLVRVSGTDYPGATGAFPNQSYQGGVYAAFDRNPDTAARWTAGEIDALEPGLEVVT